MITIEQQRDGATLRMPWKNAIAVGRAYDLTRGDLLEQLAFLQKRIGYRYCRFHALFHDDMQVVVRTPDGRIRYQWREIDMIYDRLLEMGLKPFVELNPTPAALASGEQTMFHYEMNVTPPSSFSEWGELVEAFARHLVERYGLEEVRSWYFEVWNEPNLPAFWSGTQEDYWSLYASSARALKRVDAGLRVGGPATSKASWITDFIQYCSSKDVPVDFVSTHLYAQDEYVEYRDREGSPHEVGMFFIDTVRSVQQKVAASPLPDLQIHWTEWNSLMAASTKGVTWCDNRFVDCAVAAPMIVRNCLALDDAADTLCWWVASDIFEEAPLPTAPFTCTYGLLTPQGIPKASFNAFDLMNRMTGFRMTFRFDAEPPPACGGYATEEGGVTRVLLFNQHLLEHAEQRTWRDAISVAAPAARYRIITVHVGAGAGSAHETWERIGSPLNPTRGEMDLLRAHSQPDYKAWIAAAANGTLTLDVELGPDELLYIDIAPVGESSGGIDVDADLLAEWEAGMSAESK